MKAAASILASSSSLSSPISSSPATSATVFDLLETLPRISLDRLYGFQSSSCDAASSSSPSSNPYPWTCRAVFQSLSPLAKQYVMRLLCLEEGVSYTLLESWVEPRFLPLHRRAIHKLESLRILYSPEEEEEENDDEEVYEGIRKTSRGKEGPTYTLNARFRRNLRAALSSHFAGPWSEAESSSSSSSSGTEILTPAQLESYMCAKWNGVLHFLVGAREGGFEEPAEEVQRFLRDTGMMAVPENEEEEEEEEDGGRDEYEEGEDEGESLVVSMKKDEGRRGKKRGRKARNLRITNAGIDFLLKDVHIQVWRFVEYVISHEEASRDDILTFLFQLSYCRIGHSYPVAALTPAQETLLQKFASFGLIFKGEINSSRFYPTAVAVNLIFGATMQQQQYQRASAVAGRAGPVGGMLGGGGMPKVRL